MASIVNELEVKLATIVGRLQELRSETEGLEDQKAAFEKMISVYDPEFKLDGSTAGRRRAAPNSASARVTELLKGRNNRHVVLDILRRLDRPVSTADIARQFAGDADLGEGTVRLEAALASRFSATLDGLKKQGLGHVPINGIPNRAPL